MMGRPHHVPRLDAEAMKRLDRFAATVILPVAVAAALYAFAAPARQQSPIASIRFRTALCRASDDWCFVTLAEDAPGGPLLANAVLREGGRHFEYHSTVGEDGAVVARFGPR